MSVFFSFETLGQDLIAYMVDPLHYSSTVARINGTIVPSPVSFELYTASSPIRMEVEWTFDVSEGGFFRSALFHETPEPGTLLIAALASAAFLAVTCNRCKSGAR